jgi:hypothetical protein
MSLRTSVKAGRERYPIRRGLHSKWSYILSCQRDIAADNETHCRRRRCFRSTSRSHIISSFIIKPPATLVLVEPGRYPSFASSAKSLVRTAQPGTRLMQVRK